MQLVTNFNSDPTQPYQPYHPATPLPPRQWLTFEASEEVEAGLLFPRSENSSWVQLLWIPLILLQIAQYDWKKTEPRLQHVQVIYQNMNLKNLL